MKFLMAKTINFGDLIPIDGWTPVEVPEVRTHRDAALLLAHEQGFLAPWGGRVWLHLAIDDPTNKHDNGRPRRIRAFHVIGKPWPKPRRRKP